MIVYATILVIDKVAQCDGSFVTIMTARVDRLHQFFLLRLFEYCQCESMYRALHEPSTCNSVDFHTKYYQ